MYLNMEAVNIEDRILFDGFIQRSKKAYETYQASEYNFTNIFMWRKHYGFRYAVDGNFLVIAAFPGEHEPFALFPVGDGTVEELDGVIDRMKDYFNRKDYPLVISRVPEENAGYFRQRMIRHRDFNAELYEDRNNGDYIYSASDMIGLKGKKFDGKRNHINKFKRLYSHEYMPLEARFIEDCIRVEEEWCKSKKCSKENGLLHEKTAIREALMNYGRLEFSGGVVTVNDRIEAFTLGEALNNDMAVIHIEKASTSFEGLYTYINQKFCAHCWNSVKYINREQDLGVEGIRKAKLSYHPVRIINKYSVIIK